MLPPFEGKQQTVVEIPETLNQKSSNLSIQEVITQNSTRVVQDRRKGLGFRGFSVLGFDSRVGPFSVDG